MLLRRNACPWPHAAAVRKIRRHGESLPRSGSALPNKQATTITSPNKLSNHSLKRSLSPLASAGCTRMGGPGALPGSSGLALIAGKEAFNGRFRAECLNAHWFLTLDDARSKMEDWRKYYNEVRPHGAIGNKPPITLQNYEGMPSSPS